MIVTQIFLNPYSVAQLDITIYAGANQLVQGTFRPILPGGIAGFGFTLTLKRAFDDATPALSVAGTVSDSVNCVVGFAFLPVGLTGRYVADIRRTDSGNDGPLASGQARVIGAVGS